MFTLTVDLGVMGRGLPGWCMVGGVQCVDRKACGVLSFLDRLVLRPGKCPPPPPPPYRNLLSYVVVGILIVGYKHKPHIHE